MWFSLPSEVASTNPISRPSNVDFYVSHVTSGGKNTDKEGVIACYRAGEDTSGGVVTSTVIIDGVVKEYSVPCLIGSVHGRVGREADWGRQFSLGDFFFCVGQALVLVLKP